MKMGFEKLYSRWRTQLNSGRSHRILDGGNEKNIGMESKNKLGPVNNFAEGHFA